MNQMAYVPTRKNLDEESPLRGFVSCSDCGNPLTAGWSRGRSAQYAYYYCFAKGCSSRSKAIRRDKIEGEFGALVAGLTPSRELLEVATRMFMELWDGRLHWQKERRRQLEAELVKVERQSDKRLERIVDVESQTVMAALERRVNALESDKIALREKIVQTGRPLRPFGEALRTALDFLANPQRLWLSGRLEDRRALLKLAFSDRLPYQRGKGFQTAKKSLPFMVLAGPARALNELAEGAGFEPAGGC
jgi:site-specific DNA recombinase